MKTIHFLFAVALVVILSSCQKDPEKTFPSTPSTPATPPPGTPPPSSPTPPPPSDPDPNDVVETASPVQKAINVNVNNNIGGYMEALPARYSLTTKKYPLLIFLHGVGELGNGTTDLSKVTNNAVANLIKNKKFPPNFVVGGKNYSFIVLTPQFKNWPSANDVNDLINHAITQYRVDASRIYVSGLSMGGGVTWDFGVAYGNKIAAMVPICGATGPSSEKAGKIVGYKLPVWAFHNQDDNVVTVNNTTGFITFINALNPTVKPKMTLWASGGHDAWTKATDPNYKEDNKNIYEWMLQYSRN